MTIKDFYVEKEKGPRKERIERLKELGAPTVIVEELQKKLDNLLKGKISMGGDKTLLNREYENHRDFFTPRSNQLIQTVFNKGEIVVKYENWRGHINRKIFEYKKENK